MGWTSCDNWTTKKVIVAAILTERGNRVVASKVVSNVLWTVEKATDGTSIIVCTLLEKAKAPGDTVATWAYKDMDEGMGPCFYGCPLAFLDLAPETNPEWRAKVRAEAARMAAKPKVGETWKLTEGCNPPVVIIESEKPLRGSAGGRTYRLSRKYLDSKVV